MDMRERLAERLLNDREKLSIMMRGGRQWLKKWENTPLLKDTVNELRDILDLLEDYMYGRYKKIPKRMLIAMIAAVLYVVSPIDFLPVFLDDILVVSIVLDKGAEAELKKYREWKKEERLRQKRERISRERIRVRNMRKYLIVVDMQKDFVDGSLGSPEAEAIVENVKQKIEGFDGKVIFTRDTHQPDYLSTREGRFLPVEHCIEGSDGWQIDERLKDLADTKADRIIDKPTFGSTELVEYMIKDNAAKPIESIELIGLCTDICVVSNALLLKARFPEVDIFVDPSCCAGVTPAKHEAALETMRSCQIEVR